MHIVLLVMLAQAQMIITLNHTVASVAVAHNTMTLELLTIVPFPIFAFWHFHTLQMT